MDFIYFHLNFFLDSFLWLKEEGRRKKEEGMRKKEEGRRKKELRDAIGQLLAIVSGID